MDSVTQIVLGAAVGEVCLGKRIGNRAMLWGAIAGTIPDLDVISNLWMSQLDGLAFHRGISHSLVFAIVMPFIMAWITKKYYSSGIPDARATRIGGSIAGQIVVVLGALVFGLMGALLGVGVVIVNSIVALGVGFLISRSIYKSYLPGNSKEVDVSYWSWTNFFFWTIVTHPILDCFTVYGTQLFAPISNIRVSWDNIAVADPLYTVPFMAGLIVAAFYDKASKTRQIWVYAAVLYSCLYMAWTFTNKHKANEVLKETIAELNLKPLKSMTNPTILNNFLWSGTVETEEGYYQGLYSFFDTEKRFKLIQIPKNHDLLEDTGDDRTLQILKWFSNGYYTVLRRADGRLQFNDMRYGTFSGTRADENDFIFRFVLEQEPNGSYQLSAADGGPPPGEEQEIMSKLVDRIRGI